MTVEAKEDRLEAAPTPQEEVVTKKEWVGEGRKTGGGAEAAKGEVVTKKEWVGEEEKQEAALRPRKVRWRRRGSRRQEAAPMPQKEELVTAGEPKRRGNR